MNILVVGSGQLGSRHLQSLIKSQTKLNIFVVDQSVESLALAKSRAAEIPNVSGSHISYHENLDELKATDFFLTIIATSSKPRLSLLEEVIKRFQTQHIILEKFLFQDLESYKKAGSLIEINGLSVFVNCPLRTYPIFKEIKKQISLIKSPVKMHYIGGEWVSMGCNSIHYIDLLSYLANSELLNINTSYVDSEIIPSKRPGFKEFTGTIICNYTNGSYLKFVSLRGSNSDSIINICFGDEVFEIDELSGNYKHYKGTELINQSKYQIPYQSDLTHKVLEKLAIDGTCDLPKYDESSKHHKSFLKEMLSTYNELVKKDLKSLPIT